MKKIKYILILVVLSSFLLTGCDSKLEMWRPEFENSGFEYVEDLGCDYDLYFYRIRDTRTGVNYIYMKGGYKSGICPMYDEFGKVVVTGVDEED